MSTYNPKTYRAILSDMEAWIIANQDHITDFNEGSGITSFIEAIAQQIEQIFLRGKIGFTKYLPLLPFYAFGFTKLVGVTASGVVKFSRNVATVDSVTIPIGTLVSTSSGLIYTTTTLGTIAGGATESGDVSIQASEVGADYNVPAHSVLVLTTPVVGADTVDNALPITGGTDDESDNSFQQRFREYILGLGTGNIYGLIRGAKTVTGVHAVSIVEHFPPLSGLYNVSVYVSDSSGDATPEMLEDVEAVLVGSGTVSDPGYKAAGINLRVIGPTKVTVDVEVDIIDTGEISQATITTNVQTVVTEYINGLTMGEDVVFNELVQIIMGVAGVYDLTLVAPASNVSVGSSQIARVGTITVTYS
jgi:uncharacterized phage protein gp47/JayE